MKLLVGGLIAAGFSVAAMWPEARARVDKAPRIRPSQAAQALARAVTLHALERRATPEVDSTTDAPGVQLRVRVVDTMQRPVPNARVSSDASANGLVEQATDADGVAFLNVIDQQWVAFVARAPDGREGFWVDLILRDPVEAPDIEIEVVELSTIKGRVVDKEGVGIAGADVRLAHLRHISPQHPGVSARHFFNNLEGSLPSPPELAVDDADVVEILTTDALGEFSIPIRAEGAWVVLARARGKLPTQSDPIQVAGGRAVSVELQLPDGHSFEGRVLTPEGQPVANAHIGIHTGAFGENSTTADDGSFNVAGFAETEAVVSVATAGFDHSQRYPIVADAPDTIITLSRGATLELQLCTAVSDENYYIRIAREGMTVAGPPVHFEANGCTSIREVGLSPGEYELVIGAAGVFHREGGVHLLPDSITRRSIRVGDRVGLQGRVVQAGSVQRVQRTSVYVRSDAWEAPCMTRPDGTFVISGDVADARVVGVQWSGAGRGGGRPVEEDEDISRIEVIVPEAPVAVPERPGPPPPEPTEQLCAPYLEFLNVGDHDILRDTYTEASGQRMIAGDVFVDGRGRPATYDQSAFLGRCGTSARVHMLRPITGERYTAVIARER